MCGKETLKTNFYDFLKGEKKYFWLSLWYPERNVQNWSNLNQKRKEDPHNYELIPLSPMSPMSIIFSGELFPIFLYLFLIIFHLFTIF